MVSIIIPIYNVADYLKECLDSVEELSGSTDVEVIMIDDGSTDGSTEIAKSYEKNNKNFFLHIIRHSGLSAARNYGVTVSKGDYLMFIDSDDVIIPEVYLEMLDLLKKTDADFAVCRAARLDDKTVRPALLNQRAFYGLTSSWTTIHEHPGFVFNVSAWSKLIRRSFYFETGTSFPEGYYYEDGPAMMNLHLKAHKVAVCWKTGYLWRIRHAIHGSISQNDTDQKHLTDKISMMSRCLDLVKNDEPFDENIWYALQWKTFRTDLNLFLFSLEKLEPAEAEKSLETMARFIEDYADMDILDTFPAIYEQIFKDILSRDLDHLNKVLNYWTTSHSNAPYNYRDDGSVAISMPGKLFENTERSAAHEADYIPPGCRIKGMSIGEDNVLHVDGSLYLRKVQTSSKYPQHLKAKLLDTENHGLPLEITAVPSPELTEMKGTIICHENYVTYNYNYDQGGFHIKIDLNQVCESDLGYGSSVILISHKNILSEGTRVLDNFPQALRNCYSGFEFDGKKAKVRIEFDKIGALFIVKQPRA